MSRYEASIPHVAFGIAAVAMTAITFGVSVVMPAKMESDNLEPRMVAASKVTTPAVRGVITDPASIDVAVLRAPELSAVPYAVSQRNLNPEGGVRRSARPGMRRAEGSEIRDPICRIVRATRLLFVLLALLERSAAAATIADRITIDQNGKETTT